jgi:hypothetical protein
MSETQVRMQPTPNPNSMKFVFNKTIVPAGMEMFNNQAEAEKSPIARQLFEIEGVETVFMMKDFISVNKTGSGSWGVMSSQIIELLKKL